MKIKEVLLMQNGTSLPAKKHIYKLAVKSYFAVVEQ
jgi:hypothetical protein